MGIKHRDQADLTWYLSDGISTFWRSSFGATLEWAEINSFTSDGKRVPVWDWFDAPFAKPKRDRREPSYTPDDAVLTRFAKVSRRLRRVEQIDPQACQVLETYYGDRGSRWGSQSPLGRIFSIYHMTPTAKRYLKTMRNKYPLSVELQGDEILATEVDLQKRQPNDIRRARLRKMGDEADELILYAYQVWNAATERVSA